MNKVNHNLGATVSLLVGSIYGVNSIFVKIAHNKGVATFDLIIYQFAFAILWFGGKYFVSMNKMSTPFFKTYKSIIKNPYNWLAGITTVLTGLFYYSSIQLTDPSVASLGLFQYPWILLVIGVVINKEAIILKNMIAVFFIWLGTILLIGGSIESINILGLFYGFAAGASFATYLFSLQKISEHPITKTFIITIATLLALIFCVTHLDSISLFTKDAFIYGLIVAVLGQIISFELMSYAAKRISSMFLGTFTTTELPVAMILSWIIWGPSPNIRKLTGLVFMVFSIVWLKYEQTKTASYYRSNSLEKES
jgi:drug/metabolite transporter (DMT)-like permease